MKPARQVAFEVLQRVAHGAYTTLVLSSALEKLASPQEKSFCTELVYGVISYQRRLDHSLSTYAKQFDKLPLEVKLVLRLSAYQILFLRTPSYAAVNEAIVQLRKTKMAYATGLANAILRKLSKEGEVEFAQLPNRVDSLGIEFSLPNFIIEDALSRFSEEEARQFFSSLNAPAPLWVRANTLKEPVSETLIRLSEIEGGAIEQSPRVEEAITFKSKTTQIFHHPTFKEGLLTVQDLGAQLIAHLLFAGMNKENTKKILDACAGLGGKSTHLCALTKNKVEIIAADVSAQKLQLCREHAVRLGCSHIQTFLCDLTKPSNSLPDESYDAILLDAPCSGLGVLRRHPEARWRTHNILAIAALQHEILRNVSQRVSKGGVLVYSVCTYTNEEGPLQIERFLRENSDFSIERPSQSVMWDGLVDDKGAIRTWPHRNNADAFYAVRLRKSG